MSLEQFNLDGPEDAAPVRNGNKAPDWGRNYGIRELWSEIAPGLFVGGTADSDTVDRGREAFRKMHLFDITEDAEIGPDQFDCVVTMYAWARPVDWFVEELRWGIGDSEQAGVDMDSLRETVRWAHRRWDLGKSVLVRCQAGLNRSSLVAALVLVRAGVEPAEAITTIRRRRSHKALFNKSFERLIFETPAEFWRE